MATRPEQKKEQTGFGGMNIFQALMQLFQMVTGQFNGFESEKPQEQSSRLAMQQQQRELAAQGLYPGAGPYAADGIVGKVTQHAMRLSEDPEYAKQYMHDALASGKLKSADDVMMLQGAMNKLGYNVGEVDGRLDNQTREVLQKYLKEHPEDKIQAAARPEIAPRSGFTGWLAEKWDNLGAEKDKAVAVVTGHRTPGQERGLLDLISKHESGGNYNALWPSAKGNGTDFTKMTINEVIAYQRDYTQHQGKESSAVGRYQIVRKTLEGLKEDMHLSGNEKFDAKMQDAMAVHLLEQRGLNQFKAGRMPAEEFQKNIAREWASMPAYASGRGYYDGDGLNKSGTSAQTLLAAINDIKAEPAQVTAAVYRPAASPAPGTTVLARAGNDDIDFSRPVKVDKHEGFEGVKERLGGGLKNAYAAADTFFGGMLPGGEEPAIQTAARARTPGMGLG